MPRSRTREHWNERYRRGDLPWDARRPEARLTELVERLDLPAPLALDLGCGTGDNAFWLARHGYETMGVDIAAEAVRIAQARADQAGLTNTRFACGSVTDALPVEGGSAGLALDRGCFHVLTGPERLRYAQRVAEAMTSGGWWLILCGNADEPRAEGEEGPPQLAAGEVIEPVQALFEVHRLERSRFSGSDGRPTHLAWRVVLRRRAGTVAGTPARPGTVSDG